MKSIRQATKRKPLAVCIVTQELFGWSSPSEPCAAIHALAQQLSRTGDSVTLLWVPPHDGKKPNTEESVKLRDALFEKFLIRLTILTGSPELTPNLHRNDKASLAVYHHLKQTSYDIVYFAMEGGLGHSTMLGKQTGMFDPRPVIVVIAHEPMIWKCQANRSFVEHQWQIVTSFMEKQSVEHCDHLVVCSNYLKDWMKQDEWRLPKRITVLPDMRPIEWRLSESKNHARRKNRILDEIVFFGSQTLRSGLTLFCDTVDSLASVITTDLTVTVIGPFGQLLGEHTGGLVVRRARNWPFRLKLLPKLTDVEVISYLRSRGCIAVIPNKSAQLSQEVATCVDEGIPFVATDVGGTAEMFSPATAKSVLRRPESKEISSKIVELINSSPVERIQSKYDPAERAKLWEEFHADCMVIRKKPEQAHRRQPLVSIITAHFDRPIYLRQAVASVQQQDYPNIELIVVDDGSNSDESHKLLDELEPEFADRGWRILRQKNQYLGAARNAGIRAARGQRILFLDDDNALFPNAVSDFVRAMECSQADICITLAKALHEPLLPPDTKTGYFYYYPVGGLTDLTLIYNYYGDANAMFRREVFEKVGFLNELRGFSGSDWEFFTRADLAGMKIVVVPEALYWYRSNPGGMFRSSHWYDDRLQLLELFKKNKFAGLKHFYELAISQNVLDKQFNLWNLEFSRANEPHVRLASLDPSSDEACDLLAEISATEGRADTAIILLGQSGRQNFRERVMGRLTTPSEAEMALSASGADFVKEVPIAHTVLRTALIAGPAGAVHYTEKPAHLYVEASGDDPSVALLTAACPVGAVAVSGWVFMDDPRTTPCEFKVALVPSSTDPMRAFAGAIEGEGEGNSGWLRVSRAGEPRKIEARLSLPSQAQHDVVLAVRGTQKSAKITGGFADLKITRSVGAGILVRPRSLAPSDRQRARQLTPSEMNRAKLLTRYPSQLPLLLLEPDGSGIFLRPSKRGNVAAVLHSAFPPFAKRVIASVEIAHDEASPFEFALALARPDMEVDWSGKNPDGVIAFSNWFRVEKKFELCDLSVQVSERDKAHLSIHLAIRLPKGSDPSPANAFWRKLVIAWDE